MARKQVFMAALATAVLAIPFGTVPQETNQHEEATQELMKEREKVLQ